MPHEFATIGEFISHLRGWVLPSLKEAVHTGVKDGADLIKEEAKAELGRYQDAAGSFPAWAELADSTKEDRLRQGYPENEPGLRSGGMRDSYESRVSPIGLRVDASIGSDDIKAVAFEEGRDNQSARPVLSGAAFRNEEKVARGIGRMVVRAIEGKPMPNRSATEDDEAPA